MADPRSYRPASGDIPTEPGVYRFRDEHGRVVYVGKAKNLRNRLNSYFAAPERLAPKTYAMVHTATSVEWTVVGSELESLQLEYTWIKEYKPRFNIAFRDDKSYPYLAVTMRDKFPRAQVMRGDRKKGVRYFGPYSQVWAIRETLDALLRVFPVRTCSPGVFKRAEASGRPCLLGYIDKCSAPCVGRISPEEHRDLADGLCRFMAGGAEKFIAELTTDMKDAAANMDFERAAVLRDDIVALTKAFERNAVVLSDSTDADLFAFVQDELEAAVQVFFVRGGRIRGQRGWIVEKVNDGSEGELIEQLLVRLYGEATAHVASASNTLAEETDANRHEIPRQILVPVLPDNAEQLREWLSGVRGAKVSIAVPQRGDKAELMKTVAENARHSLALHKSRRAGDITTRSASLVELQEALELPEPLMRIECYDISHVQGTNVVASMVVFEDGLPAKSAYRKFSVSGDAARDDTASMYDVITRRFKRYLTEQQQRAQAGPQRSGEVASDAQEPAKFAYPPNLVLVDGGPPQVAAAQAALSDLGVVDVHVAGIAKRLEELWLPDDDFPVILPRNSQALFLVQRIRDEAHRFAITFHRSKRGKAMVASTLDAVPGLGPAKREALIKHFGSLKKLKAASADELTQVQGVGPSLASKIREHFEAEAAASG